MPVATDDDVLHEWIATGTDWFARWITDRDTARTLAHSMIMLLEGAFVLSRAVRDPEPIHAAGHSMVALTRTALQQQ